MALGLALLPGLPAAVSALPITALSFPSGGAKTGFVNATGPPDLDLGDTGDLLCAGADPFPSMPTGSCADRSDYELHITQALETVHENPQADGRGDPTDLDPFIADSIWTVTNQSGRDFLMPVMLLFTNVDLSDFDGSLVPGGYPDIPVALDDDLVDLVLADFMGDPVIWGGTRLGPLTTAGADCEGPAALGQSCRSVKIRVRYIVSGPLPIVGNNLVLPPLEVEGAVVPEPGTSLLLGLGLLGLGAVRGRRRCG